MREMLNIFTTNLQKSASGFLCASSNLLLTLIYRIKIAPVDTKRYDFKVTIVVFFALY